MIMIKLKGSPVVICGNKSRSCVDSMDKLKVKLWAAPGHLSDDQLLGIKQLLLRTTSIWSEEEHLPWKQSDDYNKYYNSIHNYRINTTSLVFEKSDLEKDDVRDEDFSEARSVIQAGPVIDKALDIEDSDIDIIFS